MLVSAEEKKHIACVLVNGHTMMSPHIPCDDHAKYTHTVCDYLQCLLLRYNIMLPQPVIIIDRCTKEILYPEYMLFSMCTYVLMFCCVYVLFSALHCLYALHVMHQGCIQNLKAYKNYIGNKYNAKIIQNFLYNFYKFHIKNNKCSYVVAIRP